MRRDFLCCLIKYRVILQISAICNIGVSFPMPVIPLELIDKYDAYVGRYVYLCGNENRERIDLRLVSGTERRLARMI